MKTTPKSNIRLVNVPDRKDGRWDLCPLFDATLSSCHIEVFCSNEPCPYVDGIAFMTPDQERRYKDRLT